VKAYLGSWTVAFDLDSTSHFAIHELVKLFFDLSFSDSDGANAARLRTMIYSTFSAKQNIELLAYFQEWR